MMSVPGLALFYGGLVRSKNMLSVLSQVFMIVALVSIIWCLYGYSLAFTAGPDGFIGGFVGGFDRVFLKGLTPDSTAATFSNGVVIPEYVYMAFQMTFACITPALIVGSFAERMKFSALIVFIILWVTLIYFPIAHAVWFWQGPDAIGDAAKALAAATTPAAKATAQAALDKVNGSAGYFNQMGALDFAGGTVVHINAGIAGFVGALILGKRVGYPREPMPPHSLVMTMIGASLLWVGWFGFNAGSNLESNGVTALTFVNTFIATLGRRRWRGCSRNGWSRVNRRCSAWCRGAVAGLVAITPASGYCGPMGCDRPRSGRRRRVLLLRLGGEDEGRLRRLARRVRRPLHRRDPRRHRHRHPRGSLPRRRRAHRLHAKAGDRRAPAPTRWVPRC